MNNPFQKIKEKKKAEIERQEQEQQQRIDRLRQLEEAKNQKGIHVHNPIKAIKNGKEMKRLRKGIVAYEEKKKNEQFSKKILIGCAIGTVILGGIIGVMAAFERVSSSSETPAKNVAAAEADDDKKDSLEKEEQISAEDAKETSISEESTTPETSPTKNTEETFVSEESVTSEIPSQVESNTNVSTSSDTNLPTLLATDLNVRTETDYAHIESDAVLLGENEGAKITVTAPAGTTQDELVVYGDEEILDISYENVSDNTKTQFEIYVTGKKVGNTDLIVSTAYEIETKGEDANLYSINIRKLDSTDGRMAYVTPSGEKYHFSADCAGENAIKTTYYDCLAYEYEPCGKCVN